MRKILLFLMPLICLTFSAMSAEELMPKLTEKLLSDLASGTREQKWGSLVFSYSRNIASDENNRIGSLRASFVSFEGNERNKFLKALEKWWEGYGYELISTVKSEIDDKIILSYLIKGKSSDVFITIIFLSKRDGPSVIFGPRGSIDDYLFTYQEVLFNDSSAN